MAGPQAGEDEEFYWVWAFTDAGEVVSLHSTAGGARAAREANLAEWPGADAEEEDLFRRATQVAPFRVYVD